MKRIWLLGIGCSLGLTTASAFGDEPAAQLGRPSATLGRPVAPAGASELAPVIRGQSPGVTNAAGLDFLPKVMPKGNVEAPKTGPAALPLPGAAPATNSGPVLVTPGTTAPISTFPSSTVPPAPLPGVPAVSSIPGIPGTSPIVETTSPFGGGPIVSDPTSSCPIVTDPSMIGGPAFMGVMGPGNNWYASAEYLLWFTKSMSVPPLLTVGPVGSGGFLGNPGVQTIYGGSPIDVNPRSGARFSLGYWFSPKWAIEGSYFFLGRETTTFTASSSQYPNSVLARPFYSVNRQQEFAQQIGLPGIYGGFARVDTSSQLWGFEANLRNACWNDCTSRLDWIVGYRYMNLKENLSIAEQVSGLPGAPAQFQGIVAGVQDNFATTNQFHGGQIGAIYERQWGRWVFDVRAKVALGMTFQTSDISGGTQVLAGAPQPEIQGGLLALNSNSGHHSRNTFSVIPEAAFNIGYDITPNIRAFVGYTVLYWSSVARPGTQIDRSLDENRIPDFNKGVIPAAPTANTTRPIGRIESETYWAQGINFGLLFRW
jgi:hypothetical protein